MHRRAARSTPSSWRVLYGHAFLEKSFLHAQSIILLCNNAAQNKGALDVGSICALSRCIVEIHNAFAYLLEKGLAREESEFRHELFLLNHAVDLLRIHSSLGVGSNDMRMQYQEMSRQMSQQLLESNTIFISLDGTQRKNLIRGKSPYQTFRYTGAHPLPRKIESALYNLLSQAIHSFSLGLTSHIGGGQATVFNPINTLFIAIEIAVIYLANICVGYQRLRSRAIGTLSEEEKILLDETLSTKELVQWLSEFSHPDYFYSRKYQFV